MLSDPTDLAHVVKPSNSLKILNSKKSKLDDHNPCVQRWDRECSQVSEGRSSFSGLNRFCQWMFKYLDI